MQNSNDLHYAPAFSVWSSDTEVEQTATEELQQILKCIWGKKLKHWVLCTMIWDILLFF